MCDTMGWGRLEENGKLPSKLQQVSLPIIEYRRCMGIMKTVDQRLEFNTVVCAGYPEGGKDACQGDSGGPFLCQRSHGRWVLVGVTSWGLGCARKWVDNYLRPPDKRGSPGIFTNIQKLHGWISSKLNQEDSDLPASRARCSKNDGHLSGTTGTITHPQPPRRHYSNNEYCVWRIHVPEGYYVLLMFNLFSVEWDYSCDLDYLGIYSGSGQLIGKFCGDVRPRPLLIPRNEVIVRFFSDFQVYRPGFSLSYEAVELYQYPDSECGSVAVIFEEGEIQTMNHPQPYSSNAICQWVVHSPASRRIKLNFTTFELESQDKCSFDSVAVYHDLQGHMPAGKFCGFSPPDPIVSVSNVMQITFTSDYAANYIGFRAVISFVRSSFRDINPEIEDDNQPQNSPETMETDGHIIPGIPSNSQRSHEAMEDTNDVCGAPLKPPRFNFRSITTAEEAIPNSWPWHVSVKLGNTHVCSGTIVSMTFILTSAFCVVNWKVLAAVGVIDAGLHDLEAAPNAQKRRVKRVIFPPGHEPLSQRHHVALIEVDEPFQYSSSVRPVCLPDARSTLEPSDLCVVTGWSLNKDLSTKLQQQEMPVMQDAVCREYYTDLTDAMFCAGTVTERDNATSLAQSGAPLVFRSVTGNFIIYGVDIGGVESNNKPRPGVYSRVSVFSQWIQETCCSADDAGFERQDPRTPPGRLYDLSRKKPPQPERPAADDSSSAQNINVTCKDVVSLQSPGAIRLVAGGQDGPEGDRCPVIFQAPPERFIRMNFVHLNASCDQFSLIIYDGESSNKTFKARLTKENIPNTIESEDSTITIEVGGQARLQLSYTLHDQN
ncbi:ovochymase-2-like [Anomaloglossus baeobatrachus]